MTNPGFLVEISGLHGYSGAVHGAPMSWHHGGDMARPDGVPPRRFRPPAAETGPCVHLKGQPVAGLCAPLWVFKELSYLPARSASLVGEG